MAGNICRCGTYQRIRAAIKRAAAGSATPLPTVVSERQPPPIPRRRVLGRRVRRRRALRARVACWRRLRPFRTRPTRRAPSERLSRHRSRRHGAHRHAPLGDGHGHPHFAADGGRRRARCRLGPRQDHRASATPSTATRTRTARSRCATSSTRSVRPARRRARCSSRLRPRSGRCRPRECETGLHEVVHKPSGRRRRTARSCRRPPSCPCRSPTRSSSSRGGLALHRQGSRGLRPADIVSGKAVFGMDVKVEGMVLRSIEHPPVLGATLKSWTTRRRSPSEASVRSSRSMRGNPRSCSSRSGAWR